MSAASEAEVAAGGDAPEQGFTPLAVVYLVVSILSQVLALLFQRLAGLSAEGSGGSVLVEPWFFASIAAYTANGIVWPLVLRRVALSRAYPFTAFYPLLTLVAGVLVLNEVITVQHGVGMALVTAGVWILAGRRS